MSTKFEYYNTEDDSVTGFYDGSWRAQTFTPAVAHKITSVVLLLYRVGSPGTLTVSIKATDINGHPTGNDLCSGTINANNFTTQSPGQWYEITFGAGYDLVAGTKYAIVARIADATGENYVFWRNDASSPTYAGGCMEWSSNSGTSWTSYTDRDYMFEDWGTPMAVPRSFGFIIG